MKLRRRWLWLCVPGVSVALMGVCGHFWLRSHRLIDQRSYAWLSLDPTPVNSPPTPTWDSPDPKVYPPGMQSYRGTFHEWQCHTFNGRVLLRFGHRSKLYAVPQVPDDMKRYLGWKHTYEKIEYSIIYNIPRGNEFTSLANFHWNGLGSWSYFVNGDSAQYVMVPHWALMIVSTLPAALWLAVLTIGRVRRVPEGHCPKCRYDLGGITGPCPECGATPEVTVVDRA